MQCESCEAPAAMYWWKPHREIVQVLLCDDCAAVSRRIGELRDGPEDEEEDPPCCRECGDDLSERDHRRCQLYGMP